MKSKRNTLTALLLLSVLLVQLLAACGGKDDAAVTTAAETVPEETEAPRLPPATMASRPTLPTAAPAERGLRIHGRSATLAMRGS